MKHLPRGLFLCEEVLSPKQWVQMWERAHTLGQWRRTRSLLRDNTARCDVPQGRQVAEESVNL